MAFTQVPISGTIKLSDETPDVGALVTFTLNTAMTDGAKLITPRPVTKTCASDGTFAVTLDANDDTTTTPLNTFYQVTISSAAAPFVALDTFNITVPKADIAGVNLFSLATLINPTSLSPFVSKIVAGTNITISPTSGTDTVTVNASGGGGGSGTVVTLGSVSGAVAIDLSTGVVFSCTLTGNTTFSYTNWPAGSVDTEPLIYAKQDATGGHTIAVSGVSGTAPTWDTTAGHTNTIVVGSPDGGTTVVYPTGAGGAGSLLAANNLSDVANPVAAIDNIDPTTLWADPTTPDGTTDNTAYLAGRLAAAMTAGAKLRIPASTNPWVINKLVLPSNSVVDATGAKFIQASGTNTRMLVNTSLTLGTPGSARDTNISWTGGTFTKGTGQTNAGGLEDMVLMFGFLDGFKLSNITVSQSGTGGTAGTGGRYGCYLYNVTQFEVTNYTANSASRSVNQSSFQLYGGCSQGHIKGVFGTFGDDCVALVPRDLPADEISGQIGIGPIEDIQIEDVYASSSSNGVKILGGSTAGVAPFFNTQRVLVRNVKGSYGDGVRVNIGAAWIGGDNNYSPLTNGFVLDCTVENITQTRANTPAVNVVGAAEIHGLVIRHVNNQQDSSAITFNSQIDHASVKIADCEFTTAITSGTYYPITVTGTVRTLMLDNIRVNAATTGTATVAPVLINIASATAWFTARNVRVTGKAFALANLGSTSGTNRLFCSQVVCEDGNGLGYFTQTGAAGTEVREWSGFSTVEGFTKTAGTVTSFSPSFRCDASTLTTTSGQLAYNTNASTAGGVGAVYCDGTLWRPAGKPFASGTATLTAGSSGSIANTSITANSIIRTFNVSSSGTVGALSVTLSAGVGFTINSTSGTDTSKVFYEIVSF